MCLPQVIQQCVLLAMYREQVPEEKFMENSRFVRGEGRIFDQWFNKVHMDILTVKFIWFRDIDIGLRTYFYVYVYIHFFFMFYAFGGTFLFIFFYL